MNNPRDALENPASSHPTTDMARSPITAKATGITAISRRKEATMAASLLPGVTTMNPHREATQAMAAAAHLNRVMVMTITAKTVWLIST